MTTRRLKVIGGNLDGRHRVIVLCRSMAEFAETVGMTLYHARQHACETGNSEEVRQAMSDPGVAFIRRHDSRPGDPWVKLS